MDRLDFNEASAMACKLVSACTDVSKQGYIAPFVLQEFALEVEHKRRGNEAVDTESDNFLDGLSVLREAVYIAEAWCDFWSDIHHNGRPFRWLKITNNLALNGKAEAMLRFQRRGAEADGINAPHEEVWELHTRDRKSTPNAWGITAFTLSVRSGRLIDTITDGPVRPEKQFCSFVFPGLEALGYRTPILYNL